MSRQLFPGYASLSVLAVCLAVTAACGGTSDANDEAGAGSSFGGSSPSAGSGGKPTVASGGSIAAGGQTAGTGGSGNSSGAGGSFQVAGASNQAAGSGGALVTGGSTGSSGGAASGGAAGSGGGKAGSGGAAGHAGQSSGGAGGMAPTWTEIYTKYFTNAQYASNCNGSACHNPGKEKGYDFSTQANGYASVKSKTSQLVSELTSGGMPRGKPKMPAADLAVVKAWVAAGAQNN